MTNMPSMFYPGGGNHRTADDSILLELSSVYAGEHRTMKDNAATCDKSGGESRNYVVSKYMYL